MSRKSATLPIYPSKTISAKSNDSFLRYPVHRQTVKQTNNQLCNLKGFTLKKI